MSEDESLRVNKLRAFDRRRFLKRAGGASLVTLVGSQLRADQQVQQGSDGCSICLTDVVTEYGTLSRPIFVPKPGFPNGYVEWTNMVHIWENDVKVWNSAQTDWIQSPWVTIHGNSNINQCHDGPLMIEIEAETRTGGTGNYPASPGVVSATFSVALECECPEPNCTPNHIVCEAVPTLQAGAVFTASGHERWPRGRAGDEARRARRRQVWDQRQPQSGSVPTGSDARLELYPERDEPGCLPEPVLG